MVFHFVITLSSLKVYSLNNRCTIFFSSGERLFLMQFKSECNKLSENQTIVSFITMPYSILPNPSLTDRFFPYGYAMFILKCEHKILGRCSCNTLNLYFMAKTSQLTHICGYCDFIFFANRGVWLTHFSWMFEINGKWSQFI